MGFDSLGVKAVLCFYEAPSRPHTISEIRMVAKGARRDTPCGADDGPLWVSPYLPSLSMAIWRIERFLLPCPHGQQRTMQVVETTANWPYEKGHIHVC